MIEYFFSCPYCGAEVSMLLDPSITNQQYIEDCEVCCNPVDVHFKLEDGQVMEFSGAPIEQ